MLTLKEQWEKQTGEKDLLYVLCAVISASVAPMDYSLPASSVHGIFQARILEWTVISSSREKDLGGNENSAGVVATA